MRFYPCLPINIHVWGGLGSQLFALALVEDLGLRFPKRRLRLIFHTGGVTRRKLDIAPLLADHQFVVKDDFTSSSISGDLGRRNKKNASRKTQTKQLLKKLVTDLGLSNSMDSEADFQRCKPWIVSVRGHYTHRIISPYSIEKILTKAMLSGMPIPNVPSPNRVVGIQYRLGDLLEISSKSPVDSNLILKHGTSIRQDYPDVQFFLFSDSLQKASALLRGLGQIESTNLDPWATIVALTENEFFIGTNSKITQWAVIFRLHLNHNSHNLVPSGFYEEVSKSLSKEFEYPAYRAI